MRERVIRKVKDLLEKRFIRYVISGGTAAVVDIIVYQLCFVFIFTEKVYFEITPDIQITRTFFPFIIGAHVGMLVNFLISRYFVFSESQVKAQSQFLRFVLVSEISVLGNFLMMHFLWYVIPGMTGLGEETNAFIIRTISAVVVAFLSFALHKFFSFEVQRVVAQVEDEEETS